MIYVSPVWEGRICLKLSLLAAVVMLPLWMHMVSLLPTQLPVVNLLKPLWLVHQSRRNNINLPWKPRRRFKLRRSVKQWLVHWRADHLRRHGLLRILAMMENLQRPSKARSARWLSCTKLVTRRSSKASTNRFWRSTKEWRKIEPTITNSLRSASEQAMAKRFLRR